MLVKRQKKIKGTRSDVIFDLIINALLVLMLLVVLYPLYFVVIASFSDPVSINTGKVLLVPRNVSLTAYRKILQDSRIWSGYANTLIYTGFGTALGVAATLLAGYSFSRKDLKGRRVLMMLYVFTMYFSGGLIPTYMVVQQLHLTNTRMIMILLGSISVYNIIITRTFFEGTIPDELLEASFIDGCSNGRFFFSIVLPLSKSVAAVITLYYAVAHWNSFFNALIYLNRQQLYPLQLVLRDILIASQMVHSDVTELETIAEMQRIAETVKYGVIIVSSVPVLLMYPLVQKYFVKGVLIGAVKG